MTIQRGAAVRYNHSKEVAGWDEAKPTAAPLGELASLGFASDRKPKPISWARVPKKRKYGKRAEKRPPGQSARAKYGREQRARWLRLGIVKPRTDAEREIAARGAA